MSLPQSEVDRIERDAKNYGDRSHDLFGTKLNASQISYFAGAKKEASTARDKAIGFGQYLGEWGWELCEAGHSEAGKWVSPINIQLGFKTLAQLYALYSPQTETKL